MVVRKILEATLVAGTSSVTFTDTDIPNSLLRVYCTRSALFPLSQTLSGNSVTVNYKPQDSNIGVALEIVKSGLDIIDDLTTEDNTKALSANQGYVLKGLIDSIVIPTVPENITDLDDVDVTDIANGQVLAWNSTTEKFENVNQSGGGGSVSVYHANWIATSSSSVGTKLVETKQLPAGKYIAVGRTPVPGSVVDYVINLNINNIMDEGNIASVKNQYGTFVFYFELLNTSNIDIASSARTSTTWDTTYFNRGGVDYIKIG